MTPEYRAVWQASLADEKRGGVGGDYGYLCLPAGMPGMMASYFLVDFVVLPRATYVLFEEHMPRRIDTDGRPWPAAPEPSFAGTSIGRWLDSDGDGAYDTLEVETRGMKGPRSFADGSGIPLASDNQTVVKETISRPKDKPDVLIDVITTSDHALSRPWTVAHVYERYRGRPWTEQSCAETARIVKIGGEPYVIRDDGDLMPLKKGQKPPDLKYFDQAH